MSDNDPYCGNCGFRHRGRCGIPITQTITFKLYETIEAVNNKLKLIHPRSTIVSCYETDERDVVLVFNRN